MINQIDSAVWFKLNGFVRYILAHGFLPNIQYYIINEYPKSGASWIGDMLSDAMGIPFPRNRLPMLRSSILHGHMMHSWNMRNALLVWRDGRDIIVSQYYHYLFENDRGNAALVRKTRSQLSFNDFNDIKSNLPAFMKYVYESPAHPRFSWADFSRKWLACNNCVHTKYEEMRRAPITELSRIVFELTGQTLDADIINDVVERHSFRRVSGREPGVQSEKSFLRKGVVGDWKNHFSDPARELFDHYAGDVLIKLGYESSSNWVNA